VPVGDEAGTPVAPTDVWRRGVIEERIEHHVDSRRARWLDEATDNDFCHISDFGVILCGSGGEALGPAPCGYSKSAICPTCGLPRCPRCVVLDDLAERLEA